MLSCSGKKDVMDVYAQVILLRTVRCDTVVKNVKSATRLHCMMIIRRQPARVQPRVTTLKRLPLSVPIKEEALAQQTLFQFGSQLSKIPMQKN